MQVLRSILCPVDFSEVSRHALKYAATLASCGGAKLYVLYANSYTPPPYFTESQIADFEKQFRASFRQAEDALSQLVATSIGTNINNLETRVVEGLPVDAINEASARLNPDLIVLGTHGRTGVNRLLLGSVAEHVLHESKAPVLTVRATRADPGMPVIRSILCPVNSSVAGRQSLELAAGLGVCLGANVTALHVIERGDKAPKPDICAWVAASSHPQCVVREELRSGEAASEILVEAAKHDLIVIGATRRLFFDTTTVGTTTAKVVRHANAPVITITAAQAMQSAGEGA